MCSSNHKDMTSSARHVVDRKEGWRGATPGARSCFYDRFTQIRNTYDVYRPTPLHHLRPLPSVKLRAKPSARHAPDAKLTSRVEAGDMPISSYDERRLCRRRRSGCAATCSHAAAIPKGLEKVVLEAGRWLFSCTFCALCAFASGRLLPFSCGRPHHRVANAVSFPGVCGASSGCAPLAIGEAVLPDRTRALQGRTHRSYRDTPPNH